MCAIWPLNDNEEAKSIFSHLNIIFFYPNKIVLIHYNKIYNINVHFKIAHNTCHYYFKNKSLHYFLLLRKLYFTYKSLINKLSSANTGDNGSL